MKKFTLIVAAMLFAVGAFAQQNKGQWGVKGGVNIASEVGSDSESSDSRTGFHFGFFCESQIGNMVDIQPEILYSMQGAKFGKFSRETNYINVPVMVKFYVNQARTFSIDAGLQLGYMVSAKEKYEGYGSVNIYDYDSLNKFDFSAACGLSYKLQGGFDLILRFTGGGTQIIDDYSNKNSVVQLGAGYRF